MPGIKYTMILIILIKAWLDSVGNDFVYLIYGSFNECYRCQYISVNLMQVVIIFLMRCSTSLLLWKVEHCSESTEYTCLIRTEKHTSCTSQWWQDHLNSLGLELHACNMNMLDEGLWSSEPFRVLLGIRKSLISKTMCL